MGTNKAKREVAIKILRESGHTVETVMGNQGERYHVDQRMLISSADMENLADGVFNLKELEEMYVRGQADEKAE